MLTLEECQQALELARKKSFVEVRLKGLPSIRRVDVVAEDGTMRFSYDEADCHGFGRITHSTLDGIRSLLIADQKERLAEIERELAQLVVKP